MLIGIVVDKQYAADDHIYYENKPLAVLYEKVKKIMHLSKLPYTLN
jgi:hypothetical protein